ncbi:glycosyltransferase family 4 protein [Anthocerotibacter panamensis]|uniref:glycosyltransferase family 4 protein n=1 Tax=Anthocerotibacter panamensis TaxID=2857077 RepID=UPI001C405924|nr:glycosyltransferase family 4 protein [Anthocerotibacter panamensis]
MIIGHFEHEVWNKGGVAAYIRRIGQAQEQLGHMVYYLSRRPCTHPDAMPPIVVGEDSQLFSRAQELGLDLLHVHTALDLAPPEALPVVRTVHGHAPYCPGGSKYLERWGTPCHRPYSLWGCLWGHVVDHCASVRPQRLAADFQQTWREMEVLPQVTVITVSQFLRAQMLQSGYPADKLHVLPHFAPLQLAYSAPQRTGVPRFLFLGRITPEKGLGWLLRALQKVSIPVHLDIAGEGYKDREMQLLTQELGLSERVTFYGWLDGSRIHALIHAARALVFPSLWHEPAGLVPFEAMAHGRPVIASSVGGISETVQDGVNGLLVTANDVQQLAEAMTRLAENWSLAQKLGAEGWRLANEQYPLAAHLDTLLDLYEKTIAAKR